MEHVDTQYWIVVGHNHAGPYTASQLKGMGIAPDTYAWHRGLTQWVAASEIPELAEALWPAVQSDQPVEPLATEGTVVEEVQTESVRLTPPTPPQRPESPQAAATALATEPCPSSYLWWSIIVTILFSLPLGIIAIIFSAQVHRKWSCGDMDGARRSAERAYWFSIVGFVLGLILTPFQLATLLL